MVLTGSYEYKFIGQSADGVFQKATVVTGTTEFVQYSVYKTDAGITPDMPDDAEKIGTERANMIDGMKTLDVWAYTDEDGTPIKFCVDP